MIRLAALLLLSSLAADADWTLRPDGERIDVLHDGAPLTSYRVERIPFVFPLPSPSGANLARHWPMEDGVEGEERDHPHHQSLWLSHGDVNGFDFWHGRKEEEIVHLKARDLESGADSAAFTVDLEWRAGGETLLAETRRYRFSRPDERTIAIEVASDFEARQAVTFGDTKEGTFALRVDRTLRHEGPLAQGSILNSEGQRDGGCWGERARWVAFHGPDEKGEPAVLAILDHPDNLRHPTWWHARSYGLLAANPFGVNDFEGKDDPDFGDHPMEKGGKLRQRYLVLLQHGPIDGTAIDRRWNQFADKKNP